MAFKRNGSLMKHDAAGAAAFWARYYLERENWQISKTPPAQPVRLKVLTDDAPEPEEADPAGLEDTWPRGSAH